MKYPSVFLSYAREDNKTVEILYSDLEARGLAVWKDDHELLPGENWKVKIRRTLDEYEFVVLCLSSISVRKRGFFQEEVKTAAELQRLRPTSDVCIIPIRLDKFDSKDLPIEVSGLHFVDMYEDWDKGVDQIEKVIRAYHRPKI